MEGVSNISSIVNGSTAGPTEIASLYAYKVRIGLACVWLMFTVLSFLGNTLVIWSVILSKKLRTVTNAFVVNLSVADLWTSLSYPWMVVAALSQGSWPLGSEVPCKIAAVQFYTGLGTSMYSLAAIALNRLVLITQSAETYCRWYSVGKVIGMIVVTWAIPIAVFFFPPILGVGDFGYDPQDSTCTDKDGHPRGADYNIIQSVGLYPVPMVVIVSSYTALYVHLRRHFRKQRKNTERGGSSTSGMPMREETTSFTAVTTESAGATTSDSTVGKRRDIKRQQLAITKNLFVVFCVFTLLVSPYFISLTVPTSRKFAVYGGTIAITNSLVNPIIYTANHPHFKLVLRKVIRCRYSEIPEPSDWLKSLLSARKN